MHLTDHQYTDAANDVLNLLRTKATAEDVNNYLDVLQSRVQADSGLLAEDAEQLRRDLAFQCVLVVGAKSFSHLLNVLERCVSWLDRR